MLVVDEEQAKTDAESTVRILRDYRAADPEELAQDVIDAACLAAHRIRHPGSLLAS